MVQRRMGIEAAMSWRPRCDTERPRRGEDKRVFARDVGSDRMLVMIVTQASIFDEEMNRFGVHHHQVPAEDQLLTLRLIRTFTSIFLPASQRPLAVADMKALTIEITSHPQSRALVASRTRPDQPAQSLSRHFPTAESAI